MSRRMRLPNGFGQISKIKGRNLRKPYRAMVSVGKTAEGRPIVKLLKPEAYFKTYNEAYLALAEYNKNPYDLDQSVTLGELFDRWFKEYEKDVSAGTSRNTLGTWRRCASVHTIAVSEIRTKTIRLLIDAAPPSEKQRIKVLFNKLLDYAMEYEIVDKNYAKLISVKAGSAGTGHIPFEDWEIEKLWENIAMPGVDMLLVQCYGGWRPQELCSLKCGDIDLEKGIIVGGMKTDAGKDRIVPIHRKIKGIVESRMTGEYLFDGIEYQMYRYKFRKIVNELGLNTNHKPHDGRVHFVTMAKKYNLDEYAIKRIVGHKISDITERVYTRRGVDWLVAEMDKIV